MSTDQNTVSEKFRDGTMISGQSYLPEKDLRCQSLVLQGAGERRSLVLVKHLKSSNLILDENSGT